MGFNTGYNCAESTNFASDRWIDFEASEASAGYHMGFNTGYNCAESTNFASDRWIDFGNSVLFFSVLCFFWACKNALVCACRTDSVEIDMRPFMKAHRPDEYDEWYQYWYGERVVKEKTSNYFVRDLWSNSPPNLFAEKDFNKRLSCKAPHCAVCQYFVPKPLMEKKKTLPMKSKRLVKRSYYAKSNPNTYSIEEEDSDCEDRLFRCANCLVVVHEGCYP
ncbi:unnamed protein product, partial [Gongylonema pulchrum]|uniref:Phorbol-ester/DAG-type domain-containing protein n=1 Tax=Gongylonema pulchrum TaxID=637853 RepID=A0A183ERN2_9BILA